MAGVELSVVVPTLNRFRSLKTCLEHLIESVQQSEEVVEALVVDNGSTDSTREVVEELKKKSTICINYVYEQRKGLSRARNSGISLCRGRLIAVVDDDMFVSRSWVDDVLRLFRCERSLDGAGGQLTLYDPADMPVTTRTGTEEIRLAPRTLLAIPGANFVVKRTAYQEIGLYDVRLGAGTKSRSAEDTDFLYRLWKSGKEIRYTPRFAVAHAHGRREKAVVKKLREAYLHGRGAFYAKYVLRGDICIVRVMYWELSKLTRDLLGNLLTNGPWSNDLWAYSHLMRGFLYGAVYCLWWPRRSERSVGRG